MYNILECDTTQSCWGYGTYPCVIGSTPEGYKIVLLSTTGEFKPTICEESIRRVTIFKPDGMPPVAITDTTCVEGYEEKEKYA